MAEDTRDKANPLRKFVKKYNPSGHKAMADLEREETVADAEMRKAAREGRYGDTAKALGKTVGAAGTRLISGPVVGMGAAARRLIDGEKPDEEGMKSGGMTASARADGCAQRGKTRGKMV